MKHLFVLICLISTIDFARADTPSLHRGVSVHLLFDGTNLKLEGESAQARAIANAGFDFVRLTVSPDFYLPQASEENVQRVHSAVLASVHAFESQGLKVVVDLHASPKSAGRPIGTEEFTDDETQFEAYAKVAASLAEAIDHDGAGGRYFEPMNEPVLDCVQPSKTVAARWPSIALRLHDAVRKAAPRLTLVMEGGCWGGAAGLTALKPEAFHDTNIMWSFHDYAPMIFTHQGASWVGGVMHYAAGIAYPPRKSAEAEALSRSGAKIAATQIAPNQQIDLQKQQRGAIAYYYAKGQAQADLVSPFFKVRKWAKAHHILPRQILFGEFGAIRGSNDGEPSIESRAAYLKAKRQAAEELGWAWAVWEWTGSFAISREDAQMELMPHLGDALGLLTKK